jgi:NADH:ubiquinone oxidoreductase subunit E
MIFIDICMGSSCFCRGNNRNVELLGQFITEQGLKEGCRVTGHRCRDQCTRGPNLAIDGTEHSSVDPVSLMTILRKATGVPDDGAS